MVAAHRRADARRDFVTDDHRAHEGRAGDAARLRQCQRGRNGRRARVINAVAKNVIDLSRVCGAAVDEAGRARSGTLPECKARAAVADFFSQRFFKQRGGRQHRARPERGEPVDHGAFGVARHLGRDGLVAVGGGPMGELFDDVRGLVHGGG